MAINPAVHPPEAPAGPASPHQPTLSPHNYATWDDVPAGEKNYLQSQADQWEQLIGYSFQLSNDWLLRLANAGADTARDIGRYMWDHGVGTPWAAVGMDHNTYTMKLSQYAEKYRELTGQDLPTDLKPGDDPKLVDFWFETLGAGLNAGDFAAALQHDKYMLDTYGWLKHGLTFDEFQLRKQDMTQAFGHELSNEEGLTQLTYFKRAAGSGSSAAAAAPPKPQTTTQDALSEVR